LEKQSFKKFEGPSLIMAEEEDDRYEKGFSDGVKTVVIWITEFNRTQISRLRDLFEKKNSKRINMEEIKTENDKQMFTIGYLAHGVHFSSFIKKKLSAKNKNISKE